MKFPALLKVENWLEVVPRELQYLIENYGWFATLANEKHNNEYLTKARDLVLMLELYKDETFLKELNQELRDAQFDPTILPVLTRHIGRVSSLFADFWEAGFDFENFYVDRGCEVREFHDGRDTNEFQTFELFGPLNTIGEELYSIRSFFKEETWDKIPSLISYPTIDSILAKYSSGSDAIAEPQPAQPQPAELQPAQPQPAEPGLKSKKANVTGCKEQLILMDELGLLDSGKLARLNDLQKAKVLALLLNRTQKDIYELLRKWKVRKDPNRIENKYLIKEHHEQTVQDWLLDLGV